MDSVLQLRRNGKSLVFDSGMELIWSLEDAYEQKNIEKFLFLVSIDFRKDFFKLKSQLEREFSVNRKIGLYILLQSKKTDLNGDICSYEICWSKVLRRSEGDYCQREFGKATLVIKIVRIYQRSNLMLYDIYGDNPFVPF